MASPVSKIHTARTTMTEIGTTGLKRSFGWVDEEFLRDLKGEKANKIYREMESNDPIVGGSLGIIKNIIRRAEWEVAAASEDNEDERNAEFVREVEDDMTDTWEETVDEFLSCLVYGWSEHEIVWKRRKGESRDAVTHSKHTDGKIGVARLPIRAQETLHKWVFDERGDVTDFVQRAPNGGQLLTIPMEKSLLFRTSKHKNNPQGRSLLRLAYVPWYHKKHTQFIQAVGCERDTTGLPKMRVPGELLQPGASSDEVATLNAVKEMLSNVRNDEQAYVLESSDVDPDTLKPLWEFSLVASPGTRIFDTVRMIQQYNLEVTQAIGTDIMLVGHEKVGSFALSDSKMQLFIMGVESILKGIKSTLNRFYIPKLFAMNGVTGIEYPFYETSRIGWADLGAIGDLAQKLFGAGMVMDEELENYFRSEAGWPEKVEEDL